jgi:hypothetical protein
MPIKIDSRAPVVHRHRRATMHELGIRVLLASDDEIHRNGFARSVRALAEEIDADIDELAPGRFLPDAYKIDRAAEQLLLYEVVDTNPLSTTKLEALAWFWFQWDADDFHDWLPRLFIVNRHGKVTEEINLCAAYYAFLPDWAARDPVSPTSQDGRA